MPRKQARSTTLVKKVRKSTCAGNQRMQANSRNRISRLIRNRSRIDCQELRAGASGPEATSVLVLIVTPYDSLTRERNFTLVNRVVNGLDTCPRGVWRRKSFPAWALRQRRRVGAESATVQR